jgi:hypothetical protein
MIDGLCIQEENTEAGNCQSGICRKENTMIKKIIGVVLILVGAGLGYTLFTSTESEERAASYDTAVYLQDAKLVPANEGKIVIITGKPELIENAVDTDLGITFKSPFVHRIAEVYKSVPITKKEKEASAKNRDKANVMKWEVVNSAADKDADQYGTADFTGQVTVGDFTVSGVFMRNLSRTEFTGFSNALAAQLGLQLQTDKDKLYLTQAQVTNEEDARRYQGKMRFNYTYIPVQEMKTYTFVGTQKGKELVFDKDGFRGEMYEGVLTKEEVMKKNESDSKMGNSIGYVCCALMIIGGGYIVVGRRKTQGNH